MVKRTSLNLDLGLLARAREALGSEGTTDTIHRALAEVVQRERLQRLSGRDFSELDEQARRDFWGS